MLSQLQQKLNSPSASMRTVVSISRVLGRWDAGFFEFKGTSPKQFRKDPVDYMGLGCWDVGFEDVPLSYEF